MIYCSHFTKQINLCKKKESLTVENALKIFDNLKETLTNIYEETEDYGMWLSLLKEEYEKDQTFKGFSVSNKASLSFMDLKTKAVEYKNFLLKTLSEKLVFLNKYEVFKILDFESLLKEKDSWKSSRYSYKVAEINNLVEYYNQHVHPSDQVSPKVIVEEWNSIKAYLINICSKDTNKEIYKEIQVLEIAEIFIKLIQFYLVHPISNACVERGFSLMNLIKSETRNCMNDDLLDASLSIKNNGPNPKNLLKDSYIFEEAEQHWKNSRRRLYIYI